MMDDGLRAGGVSPQAGRTPFLPGAEKRGAARLRRNGGVGQTAGGKKFVRRRRYSRCAKEMEAPQMCAKRVRRGTAGDAEVRWGTADGENRHHDRVGVVAEQRTVLAIRYRVMPATVMLDTAFNVGPIDRRIFGGFLEHLGRAVYGGVYDPGNPLSDERGFRRDVIEALAPMGMPVIRYPGGNYVSAADWKDGVGPVDQRPRRPDYAWQSIETNQFGTDEFMSWCKALGTAPMMAVNLGTAGPTEAGQLLEYCNLPGGTLWSDRRKHHGHAEPYDVKLWCLGNEMDGPWQAGQVPADVYALKARAASTLMKGLDRRIQTVACGSSGREMPTYMTWDRTVLETCWETVDFISAHRYSTNHDDDTPRFLSEGIEVDRVIEDYAGLITYVRGVTKNRKTVCLSFDEWNVWYRARFGSHEQGGWREAPPLLEERYNFEDALVCAQYLGAFVRRADVVKVACIAQIVNVIAPLLTRPDGLLIQPIYYPFVLFSRHARGVSLTPVVRSPTYRAGRNGEVPSLDASVTFDESTGDVSIFCVNRDVSTELPVEVRLADRRVTGVSGVDVLGGFDVKATNTWENPNVVKTTNGHANVTEGGGVRFTIPAPGFASVRVKTERR
jgi:alpha-N-arabinofuranosidase